LIFPRHRVPFELWQGLITVLTAMTVQDHMVKPDLWQAIKRLSMRDAVVMAYAQYVISSERARRTQSPGMIDV
jgi:hypothetical protein